MPVKLFVPPRNRACMKTRCPGSAVVEKLSKPRYRPSTAGRRRFGPRVYQNAAYEAAGW